MTTSIKVLLLQDNEIKQISIFELFEEFQKLKISKTSSSNEEEDKLLTRVEVCELLHISLPTIYSWSKSGRLKPIKIGARVLFREKEIKQLVA